MIKNKIFFLIIVLFSFTFFTIQSMDFQERLKQSSPISFRKRMAFLKVVFDDRHRKIFYFFYVKKIKKHTYAIPFNSSFKKKDFKDTIVQETINQNIYRFFDQAGSFAETLNDLDNFNYRSFCLENRDLRDHTTVYELVNQDGTPWSRTSIPDFLDISKDKIILQKNNLTIEKFIHHSCCYEIIEKLIGSNSFLFSSRKKFNFFIFYKLYEQEKKAILSAYEKNILPISSNNLPAKLTCKIDFFLLAHIYALSLFLNNAPILTNSATWISYKQFVHEIIKLICDTLIRASYTKKDTNKYQDITVLLSFATKLFNYYKDSYRPNPFFKLKEFFLTDFLFCLSSYITQCIVDPSLQKKYGTTLLNVVCSSEIYYPLFKKMCDNDKRKAQLFKPIIQKIVLENYIARIFSKINGKSLPQGLALYLEKICLPTINFIKTSSIQCIVS